MSLSRVWFGCFNTKCGDGSCLVRSVCWFRVGISSRSHQLEIEVIVQSDRGPVLRNLQRLLGSPLLVSISSRPCFVPFVAPCRRVHPVPVLAGPVALGAPAAHGTICGARCRLSSRRCEDCPPVVLRSETSSSGRFRGSGDGTRRCRRRVV